MQPIKEDTLGHFRPGKAGLQSITRRGVKVCGGGGGAPEEEERGCVVGVEVEVHQEKRSVCV